MAGAVGNTRAPAIVGYRDPGDHLQDRFFMGQIVGRVANRIAPTGFDLDGTAYRLQANGPPRHSWQIEPDGAKAVELRHTLPDGAAAHAGHRPFSGLCLEPQSFLDSSNRRNFPAVVVITPDRPYRQTLRIEIKPRGAR